MSRKISRLAAVGFTFGLVTLGMASPAMAHDTRFDGPYACGPTNVQSCGYGQVRDSHQIVDACDTRADGHGFYVSYERNSGATGTVGDGNGSTSGCGIQRVGTAANPVFRYKVCSNQGLIHVCSGWKLA
ncbi:hypothetical protein [Actinoplanes sp. G11-F43]|uniref:hypothetical protein n=1 Tax=Actinoplanes sp. G11-F43 TaxID=3424130 RepID=UPI003D3358A7